MDLGEDAVKTVGLFWETQTDNLSYKIKLTESESCTKREILSRIASLFDPMGLVGPVIVVAKILMQSLWLEMVCLYGTNVYPKKSMKNGENVGMKLRIYVQLKYQGG